MMFMVRATIAAEMARPTVRRKSEEALRTDKFMVIYDAVKRQRLLRLIETSLG